MTLIGGGPSELGTFEFEGAVVLETCLVPRPRPYLFLLKRWDGAPERPEQATRWLCSPQDFADEMRSQNLEVGLDKYGIGRVYRSMNRRIWEGLVGTGRVWQIEDDRRVRDGWI